MVGVLLIANYQLIDELMHRRGMTVAFLPYLVAVPVNVLVLGMGLAFGLNDVLVAALLVLPFSRGSMGRNQQPAY